MKQTIKIKSFEITVDLDAYMREYGIDIKKEAIDMIRQTAIDAINAQLENIGAK